MKITVAGVGYVGLSLAVLMAQHNEVTAVTTTPAKAELINSRRSPIQDKELEEYLREKELRGYGKIAEIMIDGCNMGIKSLSRYINQYKAADERSKDLAKRLVSAEEKLSCDMRGFL